MEGFYRVVFRNLSRATPLYICAHCMAEVRENDNFCWRCSSVLGGEILTEWESEEDEEMSNEDMPTV